MGGIARVEESVEYWTGAFGGDDGVNKDREGAVMQDFVALSSAINNEIGVLKVIELIGHRHTAAFVFVGSETKFEGDEPTAVSLITEKQYVDPAATRPREKDDVELALNKAIGNEDDELRRLSPTPRTRFEEFDGTNKETRRE